MSANARFTFDTNILFYAADRSAGFRHLRALELTEAAIAYDCVLTLQSLGELTNSLLKRRLAPAEKIEQIARAYRASFPVIHAIDTDYDQAIFVHQQHAIPFWDAMLCATARRAGCTTLLSEDLQDGRVLGGVTVRNPFLNASSSLDLLLM